jgi:hypothetical protein
MVGLNRIRQLKQLALGGLGVASGRSSFRKAELASS